MTERDALLDELRQAEEKASTLAGTIRTSGRELDAAREQYKASEDVTERVRLAGLVDQLPHILNDLNGKRAVADRDVVTVRQRLRDLDKDADNLRAIVADAPATLATWDERITQTQRKMEGEIGRMEADKARALVASQNAQERLQALVGGG